MTQSIGRRLGGTSGSFQGASGSSPRTRILALTGEVELHRLLRSILEPNCCQVIAGAVPRDDSATNDPFDVVIVDLESLHLDVISRVVRAYPDAQILAICGAYREADCIAVLDMGADFLPRPFRALDLLARVRVAELRRFKAKGQRRYYRRGSFVIDLFDREVIRAGEPLALSPTELEILTLLARSAGSVMTFSQILAGLGRADSRAAREALRTFILRLRRRIERDPQRPDLVLTEVGVGYRLAAATGDPLYSDAATTHREGMGGRPP
jgi:two-component system KDP operon response regulator KdpE